MAYLGNKPGLQYQDVNKQTLSGNGTQVDFTLDYSSSTNDCEVFVENVQQEPAIAYTISGTTLSFTAAPPSGTGNIYVLFRGKATVANNTADKFKAVLYENNRSISENISVTSGYNAVIAGPVTVASGVTLGVPTNSRLVIV